MGSFAEFKQKCSKKHKKGVTSPHWWATLVARRISILFTWVLVKTDISANQVTIWQLIASIIGIVFLAFPETGWALLGALFLHLGYVLDNVDGEIARYKNTQSINGMFLDFVNHEIVIPATFFGLGLHYYFMTGSLYYFVAAIVILLCMFNPVGKARQTSINYLIEKRKSPAYSLATYQSQDNYTSHGDGTGNTTGQTGKKEGMKKRINSARKWFRGLWAYPNDVIFITVLLLLEYNPAGLRIGQVFLIFLSVYLLLNQCLELYVHMKNRVVERDLQRYIENSYEMYKEQENIQVCSELKDQI